MKKGMIALIVALAVVVTGIVFAKQENDLPIAKNTAPTAAEKAAAMKQWEATPEGIYFNNWKTSPAGQKVLAGAANIRQQTSTSTKMEAVVTSLTLPSGSRLGFGVMVKIKGEDYILSFGLEENNEFEQIQDLQVNDRIMISSNAVTMAPKYAFPIVKGDYVERDGKVLYKRAPNKGGC